MMTDVPSVSEPVATRVPSPAVEPARRWRGLLQVVALVCLFAGLIVGWAWSQTGSAILIWPYLQGERLLFDPLQVVVHDATAGTVVERSVRIINCTSSDVTVLGSEVDCGCITLDKFPFVIRAGEDYAMTLKLGIPPERGPFGHTIKIFSDHENVRSYVVTVTGNSK